MPETPKTKPREVEIVHPLLPAEQEGIGGRPAGRCDLRGSCRCAHAVGEHPLRRPAEERQVVHALPIFRHFPTYSPL